MDKWMVKAKEYREHEASTTLWCLCLMSTIKGSNTVNQAFLNDMLFLYMIELKFNVSIDAFIT